MSFASPWFLLGALGAVVPVLLHLFGQRRARRVLFPSLMLLRQAQQQRSRLSRLRQVWLMLLRALLLLLVSLALAQPTLHGLRLPGLPGSPVVLLVDCSASLGARGPAGVLWRHQQQALERLRASLPRGQRQGYQCLGLTQGGIRPLGRHLPPELAGDRPPAEGSLDIPAWLNDPHACPRPDRWRGARWVLLTDLQATAWRSQTSLPQWLDQLLVVDCGAEVSNVSLTGLEVVEPPVLVGRPLRLRATVRSTDPKARTVTVRFRLGGGELPPVTCHLKQGRGEALAEWRPRTPGLLAVSAQLPPDRFPADDGAYLALNVRPYLRVVAVGAATQTRWPRLALAPTPDSPVRVTSLAPAQATSLPAAEAVLITTPTPAAAQWLPNYVQQGGGLLVMAAAATRESQLPEALNPFGAPTPPLQRPGEPLRLEQFEAFREPLQAFTNARAGDLREPVFRVLSPLPPAPAGVEVLARFADGTPAITSRTCGQGRALGLNFVLDPAQTDLVTSPVFVPLLHRLVGHVARRDRLAAQNNLAGSGAGFELPPGATLATPTKDDRSPRSVGLAPGLRQYHYNQAGKPGVLLLATNLDPLEGDLTRLAPQALQARYPAGRVTVCRPEAVASALPQRLPLGGLCWFLALLLLALEMWLLRRPRLSADHPGRSATPAPRNAPR